jgi:hypothetical protein
MAYVGAMLAGHLDWAVYAFSLFVGALPEGLALIQRRGFGRRGFGRRRRPGGIFRALGTLIFVFLIVPLVILALAAYGVYRLLSNRRER